jgi:hypothetical protein
VPGKANRVGTTSATPQPPALRARLEHALSTDRSAVKVRVDPHVAELGARAVASGIEVVFAPGAYLFDGDEVARATAQQRITIASKTLAHGTYNPGPSPRTSTPGSATTSRCSRSPSPRIPTRRHVAGAAAPAPAITAPQ